MNKIVDCFMFYNELDMLQFRLEHLNDVVDYFVIAEATKTHQGTEKELIFEKNKNLYEKYLNKIIYVVVDDMPLGNSSQSNWERERYQRKSLINGLDNLNLKKTDIILLSCCDEIPNNELILEIKKHGINIFVDDNNLKYKSSNLKTEEYSDISLFYMDMYWYNLTTKSKFGWTLSRACTYEKLLQLGGFQPLIDLPSHVVYVNAGWHFTYFGDENFIVNKIKSFAHDEYNNKKYTDTDYISEKINNRLDLFDRPHEEFYKIEICDNKFLPFNYKNLPKTK